MATRLIAAGLFRSSSIGQLIQDHLNVLAVHGGNCKHLSSIFYISCSGANHGNGNNDVDDERIPLNRPVYMVQDATLPDLIATAWRHDSELGRGYILLSTAQHNGRIWRWETGGGPIAIGRSLSVEQSGCRSNQHKECDVHTASSSSSSSSLLGSGGIAMETNSDDHFNEGLLVVAEWGEGRIVRMEENGARTPLAIQVPSSVTATTTAASTSTSSVDRVNQPTSMLFTPFGDLLWIDHYDDDDHINESRIYKLKQIGKIPRLTSLPASRRAHGWTSVNHTMPELIHHATSIGGMTLTNSWTDIFMTASVTTKSNENAERDEIESEHDNNNNRVTLMQLSLQEDDDDDDDDDIDDNEDNNNQARQENTSNQNGSKVVFDYTAYASKPGAITIDKVGNIYLAVDQGILILQAGSSNNGSTETYTPIGILALPVIPVSLTIGDDRFLYIGTSDSLLRIQIRQTPLSIPTNLIIGKKK